MQRTRVRQHPQDALLRQPLLRRLLHSMSLRRGLLSELLAQLRPVWRKRLSILFGRVRWL